MHVCTNHYLVAKLERRKLSWSSCGVLRHVPNTCPLEGAFGTMRRGCAGANRSVNKSVKEMAQMFAFTEHSQKTKVRLESKGVALPKPKGKKDTCAVKRAAAGAYDKFEDVEAAMTYVDFKAEISKANQRGLAKARDQIERHAPVIAQSLQRPENAAVWDLPPLNLGDNWRKTLGPERAAPLRGKLEDAADMVPARRSSLS